MKSTLSAKFGFSRGVLSVPRSEEAQVPEARDYRVLGFHSDIRTLRYCVRRSVVVPAIQSHPFSGLAK